MPLPRFLSRLAPTCAALLITLALLPVPSVRAQPYFSNPKKQIEAWRTKDFAAADTVIIPTCYVHLMNWGKVHEMAQRGMSVSHAKMEVLAPIDAGIGEEIANAVYADLVAQFRAVGWKVVTHADVKDSPVLTKLKTRKIDAKVGAPTVTQNWGKEKYTYSIFAPTGMPIVDTGITGPIAKTMALGKEHNHANTVAPVYFFNPMAASIDKHRGFATTSVKVEATATLQLASADVPYMTAKGAWGGVKTKEPVLTEEVVGELELARNLNPTAANALSAGLGQAFGLGKVDRQKSLHVLHTDRASYIAKAVALAREFNAQVVAGYGRPGGGH